MHELASIQYSRLTKPRLAINMLNDMICISKYSILLYLKLDNNIRFDEISQLNV